MMSGRLVDLNNNVTDKNTRHSYLPLYDKLLSPIRYNANRILEIGIARGGSILLWEKYFTKAEVYGLDILSKALVIPEVLSSNRTRLYNEVDGYDKEFINKNFVETKLKFDFLLDDGPHTLQSQKDFITLYSPLMTDNGILIIEDVQSMKWLDELFIVTPEHLKQFVRIYDLRKNKNRYDDIVFTIDKINRD